MKWTQSHTHLLLLLAAGVVAIAGVSVLATAQQVSAAVTLDMFEAAPNPSGPGVLLTWHTQSEQDTSGFRLYRATVENQHTNSDLILGFIPGCGGCPLGQTYTQVDAEAPTGVTLYYWVADFDMSGQVVAYHTTTQGARPVVLPTPPPGTSTSVPPTEVPRTTDTPVPPTDTSQPGAPTNTPLPSATYTQPAPSATATVAGAPTSTRGAPPPGATTPAASATAPVAVTQSALTPTQAVSPYPGPGATRPASDASATAALPGGTLAATQVSPAFTALPGQPPITVGAPQANQTAAPGVSATPVPGRSAPATAGARPTRAAPAATAELPQPKGNSSQTQGLFLITAALIGLGVLGGVAWRVLRTPEVNRPEGPR